MNPETFNMSIRKFLKSVGVQSQREIEAAVEQARSPPAGSRAARRCPAKMTLTLDGLDAQRDLRRPHRARIGPAVNDLGGARPSPGADIEAPPRRLEGVAHRTPVDDLAQFDARTGAKAFFKCENLQRMGAFKFRGAYNALSRLDAGASDGSGVVAFSSGNHAQAVALAGSLLGIPATIVMPADAPAVKVAATRGYGAEVVLYDRAAGQDREAVRRAHRARSAGATVIPPFDHAHVIAGQGTAAKELLEETGPLDWLFVCCGGGGAAVGLRRGRAPPVAGHPGGRRGAGGRRRRRALVPHEDAAARRQPADDRRRRAHAVAGRAHVPARAAPTCTTSSRSPTRSWSRRCASSGSA